MAMNRYAIVLLAASVVVPSLFGVGLLSGCAEEKCKAGQKCGGSDATVDAHTLDAAVTDTTVAKADNSVADQQLADLAPIGDANTAIFAADACPSITGTITTDTIVKGQTTLKDIPTVICSGGTSAQLFAQAIALELTEKKTISLTFTTADSALAVLSVRAQDCKPTPGCAGGEPYNGLKFQTVREAGKYQIVVETGKAATYSLQVKLLPPT